MRNDADVMARRFDEGFDVLSDQALLGKVEELSRRERRITFNVVMHLGEVERRGIHLREGYDSMYDYCIRRLGYSESAAYRRIKTYRCIRDFPQVADLVESGALNTTTVALVAPVLTAENCDEVLASVSGKSQREVQRIVARYKTGKPFRDRIRAVVVEQPVAPLVDAAKGTAGGGPSPGGVSAAAVSSNESSTADAPAPPVHSEKVGQNSLHDEGKNDPTPKVPEPARRTTHYEFTIAADEEFMAMYQRVRAIQSTKASAGNDIATTFKSLMREYIDRHAPEKKQERREARRKRKQSKSVTPPAEPSRTKPVPATDEPRRRSRHIQERVKDQVRQRDQHQCAYVGPHGTRCNAKQNLQFDHIVPFSRGGRSSADNLRLLCAAHNRLEAAGAFGARARPAGG